MKLPLITILLFLSSFSINITAEIKYKLQSGWQKTNITVPKALKNCSKKLYNKLVKEARNTNKQNIHLESRNQKVQVVISSFKMPGPAPSKHSDIPKQITEQFISQYQCKGKPSTYPITINGFKGYYVKCINPSWQKYPSQRKVNKKHINMYALSKGNRIIRATVTTDSRNIQAYREAEIIIKSIKYTE